MPGLPQIVRERLKVSPSSGVHPDANVLTAFGEGLLPGSERVLVMDHISRCGDCREVIALALPALALPVGEAADMAATRTVQRGWFGRPSLRWGLIAAGIVAAVSVGVQQIRVHQRTYNTVTQVMTYGQDRNARVPTRAPESQPVVPREEGTLKPPGAVRSRKSVTSREAKDSLRPGRTLPADSVGASTPMASGAALGANQRSKSTMAVKPPRDMPVAQDSRKPMSLAMANHAPMPSASRPPAISSTVGALGESNQVAKQSRPSELSLQGRNVSEPRISAESADVVERAKPPLVSPGGPGTSPASTSQWAVSATGGLQRSLDGGKTWQEIAVVIGLREDPSEKETTRPGEKKSRSQIFANSAFRAVAAAGLDVWAGGTGSMLYHSMDGGEQWTRVLPSANGIELRGDIISIQFPDPQHGTIGTSNSEEWTTRDAGRSWQQQQ